MNSLCKYGLLMSCKYRYMIQFSKCSKLAHSRNISNRLVISCKRKQYNHYMDQEYNKFKEVTHASKGWNHNSSKGDYFTIYPQKIERDEPDIEFNDLVINGGIQEYLKSIGIMKLTRFQSEAIAIINKRRHALLAAETGCGKTLAYLIPIIQSISRTIHEMNTPKALVLVPNRELAYQIAEIAQGICNIFNLKTKLIVGGRTKKYIMNAEFDHIDILVGTPGAIGKLVAVGIYKLNLVEFTVLDESDTLLDDSFVERLEMLLRRLPQSQITLVSATLPKKIPAILEPIVNTLQQMKSVMLHKSLLNIKQTFFRLLRSVKPVKLLSISKNCRHPFIIFTNKNETCNWLAMFLRENGLDCANINGDMNYAIRIEQWKRFSKGECRILVATDIVSRGLDTTQVVHIINYDFPFHAADYIHRIGRIGRFGSPLNCEVINFVSSEQEIKLVQQIEIALRTDTEIPNVDGNITRIIQKKILKMQEL